MERVESSDPLRHRYGHVAQNTKLGPGEPEERGWLRHDIARTYPAFSAAWHRRAVALRV